MAGVGPDRFRVVVVCAANVCRSQAARLILADRLAAHRVGARIVVESAGVAARPGAGACSDMERVAVGAAWDGPWPAARALRTVDVADSHLLLCADLWVTAQIVRSQPSARSKTFTMIEAGALAAAAVGRPRLHPSGQAAQRLDVPLLESMVDEMNAARGTIPPPLTPTPWRDRRSGREPLDWRDVPDLHSGRVRCPTRAHRRTFDVVQRSMHQLGDALAQVSLSTTPEQPDA